MSRASNAGIQAGVVAPPDHGSDFSYGDADKDHSVWFLDVVSFLNELHALRDQRAGGFAVRNIRRDANEHLKKLLKETGS